MIVGNELVENIFIKAFQDKYKNSPFISEIIKNLFKASSIINYGSLFTLMKKNEKFNLAYLSNNIHASKLNNNHNNSNNNPSISNNQITNNSNNTNNTNTNNSNNSNTKEKSKEKQKRISNRFNEVNKSNKLNTTSKKEKTTKKIVKNPPTPIENKKVISYLLKHKVDTRNKHIPSQGRNSNNKNGIISKIKKTRNPNINDLNNIPREIYVTDNSFNRTKMINPLHKSFTNKNSSENNNYNIPISMFIK